MTEANLGELSQAKLGFEIGNFSDINRALNKIKRGEIENTDDQIGILKLVLEITRQEFILWDVTTIGSFLDRLLSLAHRVGNSPDYRIDLQKIFIQFESITASEKLNTLRNDTRQRIARIIQTRTSPTTGGDFIGTRAYPVSK